MKNTRKLALHWKIILAMILGAIFGVLSAKFQFQSIVNDWISPFGTIFINLLKLIAVPLIIVSLLKGIADLEDIRRFSKMGGKTVLLYILSTIVAISIGLAIVNIVRPGKYVSFDTREKLMAQYESDAVKKIKAAETQKANSPLQPLVDLVPGNIFAAMSNNRNMLQVIFFVILFGIALLKVDKNSSKSTKTLINGLNEIILKLIDIIMLGAPIGVFALIAGLVSNAPSSDLFKALGMYTLCVVLGLGLMIFIVYPLLVKLYVKMPLTDFFKGLAPAQLLAFSTSSSAATLPVTMECVTEHLKVDDEVSSFVLPVGATINMDGTSLYQGVAAVFIAQALGMNLNFGAQITILGTALLASIGSAAVPGAGMVMLVIVLGAIGVPEGGLALIFAMDRPLDMLRTTTNVTGDATVSLVVARSENLLGKAH